MFKEFFSKKSKKETPEQKEQKIKVAEERMEAMREEFLSRIRYVPQTYIIELAREVINKKRKIESLTDNQLDLMLAYYKNKLNVNS